MFEYFIRKAQPMFACCNHCFTEQGELSHDRAIMDMHTVECNETPCSRRKPKLFCYNCASPNRDWRLLVNGYFCTNEAFHTEGFISNGVHR